MKHFLAHNTLNKRKILLLALSLSVVAVSAVSIYVLLIKPKPEQVAQQNQQAPMSTDQTNTGQTDTTLREYSDDEHGFTIQLPANWVESRTPQAMTYTAVNEQEDIQIQLFISKDPTITVSCTNIPRDSQELTYTNPADGQRKTTYLSYVSIDDRASTLCGVMITGASAFKKGDVISVESQIFLDSLPTNRITAYISTASSTTDYPDINSAFSSTTYKELIAALKSLQVR